MGPAFVGLGIKSRVNPPQIPEGFGLDVWKRGVCLQNCQKIIGSFFNVNAPGKPIVGFKVEIGQCHGRMAACPTVFREKGGHGPECGAFFFFIPESGSPMVELGRSRGKLGNLNAVLDDLGLYHGPGIRELISMQVPGDRVQKQVDKQKKESPNPDWPKFRPVYFRKGPPVPRGLIFEYIHLHYGLFPP